MQTPSELASFRQGITTETSTSSAVIGLVRGSEFQLAFSATLIIMAKFRRLPETPQLPNSSDASAAPASSTASSMFDGTVAVAPRSRGGLLKILGMWFGIAAAV